MRYLLVNWLLNAVSLAIVAAIVPGIEISGFSTALIAALVIGLVNATLGLFLKIITFPLTIVTLGLFLIVINALMLKVAAALMKGFRVNGFIPALVGAVLLSVIHMLLRWLI